MQQLAPSKVTYFSLFLVSVERAYIIWMLLYWVVLLVKTVWSYFSYFVTIHSGHRRRQNWRKCHCNGRLDNSDGQIQIMIGFKSWLNLWWWFDMSTKDLIWKHVIWFGFDFILCDLIWWSEQITTFSNLGQGIMITSLVFLLQLS